MPPPSAAAHFWHHCRLRRPRPTPGEAEAPPQARRLPRWALPRSLANRLLQDGYSADQTAGVLGVLGAGMNPFEQARAAEGGVQSILGRAGLLGRETGSGIVMAGRGAQLYRSLGSAGSARTSLSP